MSVQPQGPGWWQASDGRWYPPQAWQGPPGGQPWPPAAQPPPAHPPQARKSGASGCVIAAVIVVVLVLAAVGVGGFFLVQGASRLAQGGVPGLGPAVSCPPAAEVSAAVGSPVREPQSGSLAGSTGCAYFAAGSGEGIDVNIVFGPELIADEQLEDFAGEGRVGGGEPESIPVGSRGQAWSHPTKSAAIAVGGGHVVLVEIMSTAGTPIGDRTAAAVDLLRRLVG